MLLNVSFGIFAFMPMGWLFMLFVIAIESLLCSKLLAKKWFNGKIYRKMFLSNMISGIVGIAGSIMLNGGWWLVVWMPWVSSNEVAIPEQFNGLIIFYLIAFILTVIIEALFNAYALRQEYDRKSIIKATLIINVVSYIIGSIILYSYSFS